MDEGGYGQETASVLCNADVDHVCKVIRIGAGIGRKLPCEISAHYLADSDLGLKLLGN